MKVPSDLGVERPGGCDDCDAVQVYTCTVANELRLRVDHARTCPLINAEERIHGQFARLTEVYGVVEATAFDRVYNSK